MVNNYTVDGKKIEVVRGYDYGSFENDMKEHNVVVRGIFTSQNGNKYGHNMITIDGRLYDTGLADRSWGGDVTDYVKKQEMLSSYYYLKY